jgi:RHS repeat-associated protein
MTQKKQAVPAGFNPLAYGELPQQKLISPEDSAKIFAKRKVPENVLTVKESKNFVSEYPNGGTSITEQARALKNDVDLIYQFVHDNVEFLPNFGLHKGGLGALVDGSGNSFDQSDLMVRLLTAAGYSAKYVIGNIKLSAAQWSNLLGIPATDRNVAEQLIANGGFPASSNPATNEIIIGHCWVQVEIDSVNYVFDPAFKTYEYIDKIDLEAAMEYVRSTFQSRAETGATLGADFVQNINDANISSDLTTFSMNLAAWIKNNNSGASLAEIVSGKKIVSATGPIRQTDLPYHATGPGLNTIISNLMPTGFKATFQFQYDFDSATNSYRVDVKFNTADIYGMRPTLWFDSSRVARFYLDGTNYGSASSAQGAGTESPAIFTVWHPYASIFANTSQTAMIQAGGQTTIGAAFGWGSKHLAAAHQLLQNNLIAAGASTSSEPMLGTSLLLIWDNFIGQASAGADIVGRISNTNQILHHFVGTISQLPRGSGSLKVISSFLAAFSTSALANGVDPVPTAYTNSLLFQALEGATNQQVSGTVTADITAALRKTNQLGIKVYDANPANWTSGTNVSALMASAGYPAAVIANIGSTFISSGWRVAMPQSAALPIGAFSNFYAYMGIAPDKKSLISQTWFSAKGAVAANYQSDADTNSAASDNARQVNGFGMPAATATENARVNMLNGRYEYSSADITVGNQGNPYELAFLRSYNSDLRLTLQGMGFGWSHNWQIRAFENSDGFIALGDQQAAAAAAAIVATYVTRDVMLSDTSAPIKNVVITSIVMNYLAERMANNVVRLQDGAGVQVFAKMADGTYSPGIGTHGACTLVKSGSPAFFTMTSADKVVYTYRPTGEISTIAYPFGITVSCAYHPTNNRLTSVSNGFRQLNFTYDTFGLLKTVNDGNSRTVTFSVDSVTGNLNTVQDPELNTTSYIYDQRGRLTQVFNAANPSVAIITNTYDTRSRVKEQLDAFGNLWQFFIAGSRSEELAPNGTKKVLYFNARGNTVREINALGHQIKYQFDGLERNTLVTMPEGNSVETSYDSNSNVLSSKQNAKPGSPLSARTTSFTYDSTWTSKVKTSVDTAGNTITYTYAAPGANGAGKIIQQDKPAVTGGVPTDLITYNNKGQVLTQRDPTGRVMSNSYDPTNNNLLSSTLDPSGLSLTMSVTYDSVGNLISSTDPKGNTTTRTYDKNRRILTKTGPAPDNQQVSAIYDGNGNIIQKQVLAPSDPNCQTVTCTYAADGKLLTVVGPKNYGTGSQPIPTVYEYDSLRRESKITDPTGAVILRNYDAMSRQTSLVLDGTLQQSTEFTANGLVASYTDVRSNKYTYEYDGFDRAVKTIFPDTTFKSAVYDSRDNVVTATTRKGQNISFTWDALNRLSTKIPDGEPTVTALFDLAGRPLSFSTPVISGNSGSGTFSMAYDSAGRFIQEQYPDGKKVIMQLDKNNNVEKLKYPDGSELSQAFDNLDRLTSVSGFGGAVTIGYDSASRKTSRINGNGTGQGFVFDQLDGLLAFSIGGLKENPALPMQSSIHFTFDIDDVGRHLRKSVSDSGFLWQPNAVVTKNYGTANNLNQYPSIDSVSCTYDSNGCLTNDGESTYTYDIESKLTSATTSSGTTTYIYDPLGRLLEKVFNGTKTRYLYWGHQRIEEYDATGTLSRRYVNGYALDERLYCVDYPAGTVSYFHSDDTSSIILSTNSAGQPIDRKVYDPWGNLTSGSFNASTVGFTGQFYEPETGLYFFKARHYSPKLGRFLQPDPIDLEGGPNVYAYCGNDPKNSSDPLGLFDGPIVTVVDPRVGTNLVSRNSQFYLPGYIAQNAAYLRPNVSYGSGGGISPYMQMLMYLMALLRQQAAAAAQASAAAAAALVAAPKPVPPVFLSQAVPLAGGAILAAGLADLQPAIWRVQENWDALYIQRGKGNSLRGRRLSYVYIITAAPGTPTPWIGKGKVVGPSGVYKYGMGTLDEGFTRLEKQLFRLGSAFHGEVLMIHPDRISARIHEAAEIIDHRMQWNGEAPVGNLTWF